MIVAVKKEDRVVVGISISDSSVEIAEKDLVLTENLPFWKVDEEKDCYVCTEDLCYSTDLLRYNSHIFKGITDGKSVIENVVPKMKMLFEKNVCLTSDNDWHNQMLIIKGNKIFEITNRFCVLEMENYAALGYEGYILGVLNASCDDEPKESILKSIRFASRISNIALFPVTIFDLKTKKRKVYYK